MVFYESIYLNVIAIFAVTVIAVVTYCKWTYTFWKRFGIPFLEPSVPFGNALDFLVLKYSRGEVIAEHYKTAKAKGFKHVGLFSFTTPEYMPIDLQIIKSILVKDFNYFTDRGMYVNEEIDPLTGNVFMLSGDKWKKIRAKLSPTFTSGKMKMMFNIVVECSNKLKRAMDIECEQGPLNTKKIFAKFTTDVIGTCAFGLDCNSFDNPNNDFSKYSTRIFEPTTFEKFRGFIIIFFPWIIKFFNLKMIPVDVSDFYFKTVRNVVEYRKRNNVLRNDFLQVLIDLMKQESGLTIGEITAQAFVFFLAGYETSATVMTLCLFELALNSDIQEKLREEVNTVMERYDQVVTYDSLNDMVYMQQILDEVMRKYPPVPFLNRVCLADYKIPNTDIVLKKDTKVLISLLGLQNDPEYFPEPEKFDPERFSMKNKEKLNQFCYMPFGEGPRLCIGLRFAFLQIKIGLSVLLKNYRFSLNEKTELPLKLNPKTFTLSPLGSVWVDVEKI
ncbi:hypothetical protein RN001_007139 [Aquatica leii]|uniref:Cytochrome P450 n=1 Tax=Aquatica leii TaxID=1421715 RepID=A0AAN7P975_9COLE|nr:hypothetical protein RN001_007139 [Aquatica leii]